MDRCRRHRLFRADEKTMGLHYRATPSGSTGFVSRITPEDNVIFFSEIEVRRLK